MTNKKEWFLTKELMGVGGLPKTERGVLKKAMTEEWLKRQKKGVRGKVYEYHYSSFPTEVIEALGLNAIEQTENADPSIALAARLKSLFPHETDFNQAKYDLSRTENILKIKEEVGCDLNWLLTGQGESFQHPDKTALQASLNKTAQFLAQHSPKMRATANDTDVVVRDTRGNAVNIKDFVFIPYYNVQLSAGSGSWVDNEQPTHSLAFRREWLTLFVTSNLQKLSVVKVKGDSMVGVFNDSDTILIDHSQTEPHDDLYAIRLGNEVFVKRLQRLPHKLMVISANPEYPPFEIDLTDEHADFAVIGKVVWLGRLV